MLVSFIARHGWLSAALFYAVVVGILVWPAIFLGRILLPSDILYVLTPWKAVPPGGWHSCSNCLLSDQIFQFYPYAQYTEERIASLQLPLWNPYVLSGVPFLASPQTAVLYPINVLRLIFSLDHSLVISALVRLLIAGCFTYLFGRQLGLPRSSAVLAGLAFMLCAYNVVWLGYPHVNTVVFLPVVLFLMVRCLTGNWLLNGSLLALAVACAVLGGHPETLGHMLVVIVPFGLVVAARNLPAEHRLRVAFRRMVGLAVAGAAGLALAAVVLLPFVDYLLVSTTLADRTTGVKNSYMLPFSAAITFFAPHFFGSPATQNYWGPLNANEATGYVGVLTLCLALVAVTRLRRDWRVGFFVGMTLFALLIIFGVYPIFDWFTSLPGFHQAANHRMLFVAEFGLAMLAGLGHSIVATWSPAGRRGQAVTASLAVGSVALLAAVAFWLATEAGYHELTKDLSAVANALGIEQVLFTPFTALLWFGLMFGLAIVVLCVPLLHSRGSRIVAFAPVILAVDLLVTWYGYNPSNPPDWGFHQPPPSIAFLQKQTGWFRMAAMPGFFSMTPDTGLVYGLTDVRGEETPSPSRYRAFYQNLIGPTDGGHYWLDEVNPQSLKYLSLLGVRYLLSPGDLTAPGLRKVYDAEVKVYENPAALPNAFLVSDAIPIQRLALSQAMDILKNSPTFDPSMTAVIEPASADAFAERIGGALPSLHLEPAAAAMNGSESPAINGPRVRYPVETVRVTVREPERLELQVRAPVAGYVVITDSYDSGWHATVNGQPADVLPCDGALQAVKVPAGESKVDMTYLPESFVLGKWASSISGAGILVGLVFGIRRRRAGVLTPRRE